MKHSDEPVVLSIGPFIELMKGLFILRDVFVGVFLFVYCCPILYMLELFISIFPSLKIDQIVFLSKGPFSFSIKYRFVYFFSEARGVLILELLLGIRSSTEWHFSWEYVYKLWTTKDTKRHPTGGKIAIVLTQHIALDDQMFSSVAQCEGIGLSYDCNSRTAQPRLKANQQPEPDKVASSFTTDI